MNPANGLRLFLYFLKLQGEIIPFDLSLIQQVCSWDLLNQVSTIGTPWTHDHLKKCCISSNTVSCNHDRFWNGGIEAEVKCVLLKVDFRTKVVIFAASKSHQH